ncbi:hypothetical protein N7523_007931 [Penicillium sp. IBT 18751x]|nr:hypothetical protein N7523_007931 [Penicillium sp. IBT 18751x]
MADPDPFVNSLVNKTAPDPYQQAIFLSQKTINRAFLNMWELADPSSPIRSLNVRDRAGNRVTATLKAPTVLINVADNNAFMAYLQWNFDQGQMTLYTSDDPNDPATKTFDVANWVYAFGSGIGKK